MGTVLRELARSRVEAAYLPRQVRRMRVRGQEAWTVTSIHFAVHRSSAWIHNPSRWRTALAVIRRLLPAMRTHPTFRYVLLIQSILRAAENGG